MKRLLPLLLLAGCNSILGIGGDDFTTGDDGGAPDAPTPCAANTVCGVSRVQWATASGIVPQDEDLSGYIIEALLPDSGQPSGFQPPIHATSTGTGTFEIANVPDGVPYYLAVIPPSATQTLIFVTDSHTIDLDHYLGGRPDAVDTGSPQPVSLSLSGMQPYSTGDYLIAESYNTTTEEWQFDYNLSSEPAYHGTTLNATFDFGCVNGFCYSWRPDGRAALVQASKGDDLELAHVHHAAEWDTGDQRAQGVDVLVDRYETSNLEMTAGQTASVTGAFTPVTRDQSAQVGMNRLMFDNGYAPTGWSLSYQTSENAGPELDTGVFVAPPLWQVNFTDWRGGGLQSSTVAVSFGDPYPAAWPRMVYQAATRFHDILLPGTTSRRIIQIGYNRQMPFAAPVPSTPNVTPPQNIKIDGVAALPGGRVSFDGTGAVHLTWNSVATASWYTVNVLGVYADGPRTRTASIALLSTADTSVDVPADLFVGSEYYVFTVAAVRDNGEYAQGHLRRTAYPRSQATEASGLFRLSTHCGDGTVQAGEDCDPGAAAETAGCDADCTLPVCGDGYTNVAAGEQCDSIDESPGCEASTCKLPTCGDGYIDYDTEDCDTMGDPSCPSNCKRNQTCGNGTIDPGEGCDDGNQTDDGNGCDVNCLSDYVCGDGLVEPTETCDPGPMNYESTTCDGDCSPVACGDGYINATAGEECDYPGQKVCQLDPYTSCVTDTDCQAQGIGNCMLCNATCNLQ